MRLWFYAFFLVLCSSVVVASITGDESITVTLPADAVSSSSFPLTFTVVDAVSPWGATIEASITGGCHFPDGTASYRDAMYSPDGMTKTITMSAGAAGSCTFSGNYQFGNLTIVNFLDHTITITALECNPNWYCDAWSAYSNSSYSCGNRTRTCSDANSCNVTTGMPTTTNFTSCPITQQSNNGQTENTTTTSTTSTSTTSTLDQYATNKTIMLLVLLLIVLVLFKDKLKLKFKL